MNKKTYFILKISLILIISFFIITPLFYTLLWYLYWYLNISLSASPIMFFTTIILAILSIYLLIKLIFLNKNSNEINDDVNKKDRIKFRRMISIILISFGAFVILFKLYLKSLG